ncbi:MAG: Transglutaminase-like superfamily protein [Syntrophaceae bacterium PtaU1.Bin231]|nr:MAG: Transglutaminase-like superfamily protein [Syntrophaceae bacterium PtaU1.Bin231]
MAHRRTSRWPLIAGGAFALVFLALLAVRLDLVTGWPTARPEGRIEGIGAASEREEWFSISQGVRRIGYARRRLIRREQGYRSIETVFMQVNTMGVVHGLTFTIDANLLPDMRLSSFRFDLKSSLFRFQAAGTIKDKLLSVATDASGEERKINIPLEERPYTASGIFEAVRLAEGAQERPVTFSVFDPASMGQRAVRVSPAGEETLTVMGQPQKVRKYAVDFMGARQFAWINEKGEVVKEEGLLGIVLERVPEEEALGGMTGSGGADVTEIASVSVSTPIGAPEKLQRLRLRLGGIDTKAFHLDGDRQRFEPPVLTITREKAPVETERSVGLPGAAARSLLKPNPFIQSDHPRIRRLAERLAKRGEPPAVRAANILAWVHKNIEKRPVLSVPNALETLDNGVGDCNEHAALLAALLRASNIPAEIEAGLVYTKGRFYYHAWNVLYIGRWITADAVFGQMPADATHIRLIRGGMERQMDLMGVIGNIELEVLEQTP